VTVTVGQALNEISLPPTAPPKPPEEPPKSDKFKIMFNLEKEQVGCGPAMTAYGLLNSLIA
jgi:hypothetical protein